MVNPEFARATAFDLLLDDRDLSTEDMLGDATLFRSREPDERFVLVSFALNELHWARVVTAFEPTGEQWWRLYRCSPYHLR